MSGDSFAFSDLLDDGPAVVIKANLRVLPAPEGGHPIRTGARPNHNFGTASNREFYIGQIELDCGEEIAAGESGEIYVRFLSGPGLRDLLTIGRSWRLQAGARLIAEATITQTNCGPRRLP